MKRRWQVGSLLLTNKKIRMMKKIILSITALIVFHCPIFDFSIHHDPNTNEQQFIQNLCETNNVQLVLNGHNHYYSHWMINNIHHLVLG